MIVQWTLFGEEVGRYIAVARPPIAARAAMLEDGVEPVAERTRALF